MSRYTVAQTGVRAFLRNCNYLRHSFVVTLFESLHAVTVAFFLSLLRENGSVDRREALLAQAVVFALYFG